VRARAAGAAALALATVLGGCGGGEGKGSDADQVTAAATTFAHAFGTGDGKKACSLLTPGAQDAFVKRVSSLVGTNDCAQAIVKLQAVAGPNVTGPLQDAKASNPRVNGDHATVALTAAGGTEQVQLEKRDGDWLLTRAPGT
jgi:hypothetical protein